MSFVANSKIAHEAGIVFNQRNNRFYLPFRPDNQDGKISFMDQTLEIYVVYGFAFLLLGIVAAIQPPDPRGLPLSKHLPFLSAFGLIHGGKELFDAWLIGHDVTAPSVNMFNSILLLISFLPLVEFGRRSLAQNGTVAAVRRFLSKAAYVYSAIAVSLSLFWVIVGLDWTTVAVGARYFVGFPAAFAAGFAFWNATHGAAKRSLALSFFAYGLFGGMVVESGPLVPGWLVTNADFSAALGIPVQVFRGACAVVSAVCIVIAVRTNARLIMRAAYQSADEVNRLVSGLEQEVAERTKTLRESQRNLTETLETLQLAKDAGKIGTWKLDIESRLVHWDAVNAALHGLPEKAIDSVWVDWAKTLLPDDLERVTEEFHQALAGEADFDTEYRVVLENGAVRHLKGNAKIVHDASGKAVAAVGMNYDLTPLREKEAELIRAQRIADQAQKLEAIGHLTGGIAHDFNNLLAVIHGNLELLLDEKDWSSASEAERLDIITSALSAARRGGELTKNMLAFARKSTLQPKTLDINEVVKETERWLSRTIPSNIQIETNLQSRTWPVRLDPASLQSAIVNTVVNARDAMPEGGKLTIETSNLRVNQEHVQDIEENIPPGRYTMLAITDTGTGIDGADLSKIFDPFFSTKQVGAGTGLGLSMVQGFVKQSNGFVRAYSEVGVGTSIKLYFPAIEGDSGARPIPESDVPVAYSEGTSARLLVVDDKVEILAVLRRVLKSAGYAVDTAVDGDAAFELFQSNGPYDLLITDIVMPSKLQGPGLAKALREIQPDLPAIFMSGYASEATVHGNGLKVDDIRLMKPVPHIEMLESVRKCLESR